MALLIGIGIIVASLLVVAVLAVLLRLGKGSHGPAAFKSKQNSGADTAGHRHSGHHHHHHGDGHHHHHHGDGGHSHGGGGSGGHH
jgi:hypothetical protein